jgi:hypothetical protein
MKRLQIILLLSIGLALAACSAAPIQSEPVVAEGTHAKKMLVDEHVAGNAPDRIVVRDERGSAILQKVAFQTGVSSATVERLGRRFGCIGLQGAGLVTEKGPVEVYRMRCDNGTTFLAECELRQCRPMR